MFNRRAGAAPEGVLFRRPKVTLRLSRYFWPLYCYENEFTFKSQQYFQLFTYLKADVIFRKTLQLLAHTNSIHYKGIKTDTMVAPRVCMIIITHILTLTI